MKRLALLAPPSPRFHPARLRQRRRQPRAHHRHRPDRQPRTARALEGRPRVHRRPARQRVPDPRAQRRRRRPARRGERGRRERDHRAVGAGRAKRLRAGLVRHRWTYRAGARACSAPPRSTSPRLPDSYAARTGRPGRRGRHRRGALQEEAAGAHRIRARRGRCHSRSRNLPRAPRILGHPPPPRRPSEANPAIPPRSARKPSRRWAPVTAARRANPAQWVDFERATPYPVETITIYYDSTPNLVAQGVIRDTPRPARPESLPRLRARPGVAISLLAPAAGSVRRGASAAARGA